MLNIAIQSQSHEASEYLEQVRQSFPGTLAEAGHEIAGQMEQMFRKTTDTWSNPPQFSSTVEESLFGTEVETGTDDQVYAWVNDGTPEHRIAVRYAQWLVYPQGYITKTVPRRLGSRPGGHFGDLVFRKAVHHPGAAPRHFDEVIAEQIEITGAAIVEHALEQVIDKEVGSGL